MQVAGQIQLVPCSCKMEVPIPLQDVNQSHSDLRGHHIPCHVASSEENYLCSEGCLEFHLLDKVYVHVLSHVITFRHD